MPDLYHTAFAVMTKIIKLKKSGYQNKAEKLSAFRSDTHPDLPNSQPGGWLTFNYLHRNDGNRYVAHCHLGLFYHSVHGLTFRA